MSRKVRFDTSKPQGTMVYEVYDSVAEEGKWRAHQCGVDFVRHFGADYDDFLLAEALTFCETPAEVFQFMLGVQDALKTCIRES